MKQESGRYCAGLVWPVESCTPPRQMAPECPSSEGSLASSPLRGTPTECLLRTVSVVQLRRLRPLEDRPEVPDERHGG